MLRVLNPWHLFFQALQFTLILHDLCISPFLSVLPLSLVLFYPPLSCFFFSQGHGFFFLSVASPEQISALKCLLQLVSLTLLIILHSHDNSPLVSHLEFISFFLIPLNLREKRKKKLPRQEQFYFKNVENAFDVAAHQYVTLVLALSCFWKNLDACGKQSNHFSVS